MDGGDREPEAGGTVGMVGGGAGARVNAAVSGSGAPRVGMTPRERWLVARPPWDRAPGPPDWSLEE